MVVHASFAPSGTGRTGTIQTWTVPASGGYQITAKGAAGGSAYLSSSTTVNPGGRGARVATVVDLTAGDVIQILVGQKGGDNPSSSRGSGGGGATIVYNQTTATLLLIVGAGGGGGQYANDNPSADASLGPDGKKPTLNSYAANGAGAGGTGGNGGAQSGTNYTGGGAGWITNGGSSSWGKGGEKWDPAVAGTGEGGVGYADGGSTLVNDGGFGGGGGGYAGSGGGAGYSGGGGGSWSLSGPGGGGGTYVLPGALVLDSAVDNTGAGSVEFADPPPPAAHITAASSMAVAGDTPYLPAMFSPLEDALPKAMVVPVAKGPYYGPYLHDLKATKCAALTDYNHLKERYPEDFPNPGQEFLTDAVTLPEQVYD